MYNFFLTKNQLKKKVKIGLSVNYHGNTHSKSLINNNYLVAFIYMFLVKISLSFIWSVHLYYKYKW